MNQVVKMSHPPPLAPRNSNGAVTSPSPSSPLTVKMNGVIPPPTTPSLPVVRNHVVNGLPLPHNASFGKHNTSCNTPTKPYELSNGPNDSKVLLSHSLLHDTSQELMSRSILSGASGVGIIAGPRLRTPNPIPTPTPTAPSSTTLTGTVPSPTLMMNPVMAAASSGTGGGGSTTSASRHDPHLNTNNNISTLTHQQTSYRQCCNVSVNEILYSLALLAVVSLFLAALAVLFLLKVMSINVDDVNLAPPNVALCNASAFGDRIVDANEFRLVYEIVVGLTTCTISLDFTCMLVCCAQFIFASKLAKTLHGRERAIQYLKSSACSRVIAIGGFFISIPVLLTGIILYAFIQFEAKSAIITSSFIGLSIVFCGLAMIHNVYVWQQQKTKASVTRVHRLQSPLELKIRSSNSEQSSSHGLDLTQNASMELSTLV